MVQPLPNGQALVAGARAAWLPDRPEHNATIYGTDGSPLLTACVGDGIEQVRATPTGAVWLGYFDEGVYGNLGWGDPPGPEPIGWPGLLKMTSQLAIEWRYPADELEPIDDCYALNLAGEVAWACPYSTFCVTRVEDAQVRLWPNQMEGTRNRRRWRPSGSRRRIRRRSRQTRARALGRSIHRCPTARKCRPRQSWSDKQTSFTFSPAGNGFG